MRWNACRWICCAPIPSKLPEPDTAKFEFIGFARKNPQVITGIDVDVDDARLVIPPDGNYGAAAIDLD